MGVRGLCTGKTLHQGKERPSTGIKKSGSSPSVNSCYGDILRLQGTIGNHAVERLFKSGVIQAKLKIGQPNDIYEQEANRVAEQVVRLPEPALQPKPA